jgi:hypothetical protein
MSADEIKKMNPTALAPDEETKIKTDRHGRQWWAFLMHGDNATHSVSQGCIVVSKWFREWIQANGGGVLVVKEYPDVPNARLQAELAGDLNSGVHLISG